MISGRKNEAARGNCYGMAYLMMQKSPLANTDRCFICHGVAVQTRAPFVKMGHGWLEEKHGEHWFCRDGLYPADLIPRDRYYKIGNIDPATVSRYTRTQAKHLYRKFDGPGPWSDVVAEAAHD